MTRPLWGPFSVVALIIGGILTLMGGSAHAWRTLSRDNVESGVNTVVSNWPLALTLGGILLVLLSLSRHGIYGLQLATRSIWRLAVTVASNVMAWPRLVQVTGVLLAVFAALVTLVEKSDRLDLIKAFVWPAVALTVVLLFRRPFGTLIDQVDQAEGWGMRISRKTANAEERSKALRPEGLAHGSSDEAEPGPGTGTGAGAETGTGTGTGTSSGEKGADGTHENATNDEIFGDFFRRGPDDSAPASIILRRWEGIRQKAESIVSLIPERASVRPAVRNGLVDPTQVARSLVRLEVVAPDIVDVINELRQVRNLVAHARTTPDNETAWSYDSAARNVVEAFHGAEHRLKDRRSRDQ